MGSGGWTHGDYANYARTTKASSLRDDGSLSRRMSVQEMYTSDRLHPDMDIREKFRECCDSAEHPNTIPVILALDVTGSMHNCLMEVAESLNPIMTSLYGKVTDIEFAIMAIGDLSYDAAPIQISQFESDIRIAENLDKVYFEQGGGGNSYESYTAAWEIGLNRCRLDCWKRGKKGIIITLGDEMCNPYLPGRRLSEIVGHPQILSDVETKDLYPQVCKKFNVYHVSISDSLSYKYHSSDVDTSWAFLGNNYAISSVKDLKQTIERIILSAVRNQNNTVSQVPVQNDPVSGDQQGFGPFGFTNNISW